MIRGLALACVAVLWLGCASEPPAPASPLRRDAQSAAEAAFDCRAELPAMPLVIDATGSMSGELEYLKVEIDSIAAAVKQRFPNVDQRFSLIVYRDKGDEYVVRKFDFTGSLAEFRRTLSGQRAAGGGDYPEAMHKALEDAGDLDWRERAVMLALLAPIHFKRSFFEWIIGELGIPEERTEYLRSHGHMSGIDPLVGIDHWRDRLRPGDAVLLLAAGTGYTWAASVIRW